MRRYTVKQLQSGKWAIFNGQKYYTSTVVDSKLEADQTRLEWLIHDHHMAMDDAFAALMKISRINDDDEYELENGRTYNDISGWLC